MAPSLLEYVESIMTASRLALAAVAVLAGVAAAAPPPGGPSPGGGPPAGGASGGPPPGGRPPGGPPPAQGAHPGGGHGHWHGPTVGFHYGGPYWGAWAWPGYYWPGYYGASYYSYGPGLGYLPPSYIYGPPAVVTSTGGVVYIERESGTVSTHQPERAPAPDATTATPPPGTQWWYLCSSPRGAYPYVRECPGGWERVPAVPPGQVK